VKLIGDCVLEAESTHHPFAGVNFSTAVRKTTLSQLIRQPANAETDISVGNNNFTGKQMRHQNEWAKTQKPLG
jgi:hypothetical protein